MGHEAGVGAQVLADSELLGLDDGGMQGPEVRVPHLHLPGQGHLRHEGVQ